MKTPASKPTLIAGMMAIACLLTVTFVHASTDDAKAEKKQKKAEVDLKKYDKNANGKLDPDEEAAVKADIEKQKNGKRRRNEGN
jgi:hypothetical protein